MAINIRIENLNVTSEIFGIVDEQLRGAGTESLRDNGYAVPAGTPEHFERLQAQADETIPISDHIMPHLRRASLYKFIETAGKKRKIIAGILTTQETSIKDLGAAKVAHERYSERIGELLTEACGACVFKDNCKLEAKPDAWLRRHPTKPAQIKNRLQEALPDFIERLDQNPMAHCVPPGKDR